MNLIIDGNHTANRVKHAYPELTTKSGKRVHVTFGFLKVLGATIKKFKPDSVMVAWDGHPEFRKTVHPEYKARRQKPRTDDEKLDYERFKQQLKDLSVILPLLGVHQYKFDNVEADDLISILSSKGECVVVSEDKDFYQLISKDVTVYMPIANRTYTLDKFLETFEITPAMFLHARTMIGETGETSDNIPGVNGIGEKIAFELVKKYGTIQAMLAHPEELRKSKRLLKILESVNILVRNFILMDLSHSANIVDFDIDEGKIAGRYNEVELKREFMKLEFFSFLRSLPEFLAPFKTLTT